MFQMPYHRESILFRESYSDASVLQKNVWKSFVAMRMVFLLFAVFFLCCIFYIQINVLFFLFINWC